jgi:CHAT domain-containing protein
VIASLWQVDDEATQALMVSFYRHWLEDQMGIAQALQAAQADVRAVDRWASPYFWSGFVLTGDSGLFNP